MTTNTKTVTDRDVRTQIIASLAGRESEFDVDLLVDSFISRWGCIDMDSVPEDIEAYWGLVSDCAY